MSHSTIEAGQRRSPIWRRPVAMATGLITAVVTCWSMMAAAPTAAHADVPPTIARADGSVTADSLPTVQLDDGVAWTSVVRGNVAYVGGSFSAARPAGSAKGQNLTARGNLLAFDVTSGELITSFAPNLDAQVNALALSPDGSRLYVGGKFVKADGVDRYRIAAYDTATGALVSSFQPVVNASVYTMVASYSTLYVGGAFQYSNSASRPRLAAFSASTGALLTWAPVADDLVRGMTLSPDGTKVIVGGNFTTINGAPAYGMGAIDAVTGESLPWAANTVIRNAGSSAGVYHLTTKDGVVYGTNYNYGTGNYEGPFAVDGGTGAVVWLADCHGDTYASYATTSSVYTVGHAHHCANIGGFPDTNPRSKWYRAMAFTPAATGTVLANGQSGSGYGNFVGQPAPSIINWFPDLTAGSFTGQTQAAWSVSGNDQYVVAAGEFPSVNGAAQYGITRFAPTPTAPGKRGPQLSGPDWPLSAAARPTGGVNLAWQTNWDQDDLKLTYSVMRADAWSTPICTIEAATPFWKRQWLTCTDPSAAPGGTYRYSVKAVDANGNSAFTGAVDLTVPASGSLSPYAGAVLADAPSHYWRLGESPTSVAADLAGSAFLAKGTGVTGTTDGAVSDDPASVFNGASAGTAGAIATEAGPGSFSLEAWVSTTSAKGGKVVGFGDSSLGTSTKADRHIYMDNTGRLTFGLSAAGVKKTVTSPAGFNNGQWHHVVGTVGANGMRLYVDGIAVAVDGAVTVADDASAGYWRIGGDQTTGWTGKGTSNFLAGSIDDVAVYPSVLSPVAVNAHYAASGRTSSAAPAPADAYGKSIVADQPSTYWRLDEQSGTAVSDSSYFARPGTTSGGVTRGTPSAVTAGYASDFNGSTGTVGSSTAYPAPTVFSTELWFSTTTKRGGKLIGYGNKTTGASTSYDRHVYMLDNGQLVFGVNNGAKVTVTSPVSYNDGLWHHVVATMGADGMKLYVDGALVGSDPNAAATVYTGYWRVGGDTKWAGTSAYFAGSVDEVAVYPTVLSADRVKAHYAASAVAPNVKPTAAAAGSCVAADCSFDATGSTDVDGTVSGYTWDFGDGNTGTGATATHTYAASGSYSATVTVTDDDGATATATVQVQATVPPPNQAPTAVIAAGCANGTCQVDGSGSSDPDGSIAGYAWDFGDGQTGTGATASHTYQSAGTYTVTLTVTDDKGLTATASQSVESGELPNQAPTAAFTATAGSLQVGFDASGSFDPDGSIAGYVWDFGDGQTGTGASVDHTYAGSGVRQVSLTVTDDRGATNVVTKQVVVPAGALLASDVFDRTTTTGWGATPQGGGWTVTGGSSVTSVDGTQGKMKLSAGNGPTALLGSCTTADANIAVDLSLESLPTGGGLYVSTIARNTSAGNYRLKVRVESSGAVSLILSRVVSGAETTIASKLIAGLSYAPGDVLHTRFVISGTGTTTLAGKVWKGTAEPSTPQVTATDTTAALQTAGSVGVQEYLSGSATAVLIARIDNLVVSSL